MTVVPVAADTSCDFLCYPPVLSCVAGHFQCLPAHLNLTVGIGYRAVLFRPGRGRQYHVGVERGLGQKNILDDQVLQFGQCRTCVINIRIGHGRVFTHDVHALDPLRVDGIYYLDDCQPTLGIQRGPPQILESLTDISLINPLVIREHHRDQPGI